MKRITVYFKKLHLGTWNFLDRFEEAGYEVRWLPYGEIFHQLGDTDAELILLTDDPKVKIIPNKAIIYINKNTIRFNHPKFTDEISVPATWKLTTRHFWEIWAWLTDIYYPQDWT